MARTKESTSRTRQNLVEAFWWLYCRKSIEKISVKEIAARAGYNRGTFYEYFTDVYAVLEHLELSLLPGSPAELPPRTTGEDDGRPLERFVDLYERNRDYFVVLLGEHGDPGFQQRIKRHMRPILRSVLAAEGPADDLETEVTVEFVLAAMIGVLGWWFARPHASSTARLIALVQDLMEKGALHRWKNRGRTPRPPRVVTRGAPARRTP